MKNIDRDLPVGKLERVADFLPSPSELVPPEPTVKITILVKKSSVDFFKRAAAHNHTKYQRLMRVVLDRYATHHQTRS